MCFNKVVLIIHSICIQKSLVLVDHIIIFICIMFELDLLLVDLIEVKEMESKEIEMRCQIDGMSES